MGHRSDMVAIYTCDGCGKVIELDGMIGGPLGGPSGWRSLQPATTSDGDWLCSWECLATFATTQAERKAVRLSQDA